MHSTRMTATAGLTLVPTEEIEKPENVLVLLLVSDLTSGQKAEVLYKTSSYLSGMAKPLLPTAF